MRLIVLNVYKSEALDFLEGFDYAVLIADAKLPEDLIEAINKAKDLKFEDRDFFSLSWFDGSPYFIDATGITNEEQEVLCDEAFIVVERPADFLKDKGSRVELCKMVADDDGVWWEARPKHVDYNVETRELPLEFLEKLKKGGA